MATRKKKSWFKVCPERWLYGSTREEMTNAERAVWMDFLARAAVNDPPGQISFMTEKRLANELNISVKLLKSVIKKAEFYGKIDIEEDEVNSNLDENNKKNYSTCDQTETKSTNLVSTRSKIGLPLKTIKILKWNEYQNEWLRQKPYRSKKSAEQEDIEDEEEHNEELQNPEPENVTQVTDRGEERRGDKIRIDKRRGGENEDSDSYTNSESESSPSSNSNSPSPFSEGEKEVQKKEFLSMLKACPGYPFDEEADSLEFECAINEYPGIDILRELDKKIIWWKEHPGALKQGTAPRSQLDEWFQKECEYQRNKRGF